MLDNVNISVVLMVCSPSSILRAQAIWELALTGCLKSEESPKSVNNRIDLYSATGAIMPGKPYKPAKVLKLIAARRAQWITEGVSAQLLYWTDAELEEDRLRNYKRELENRSDEVVHMGEWRPVQYRAGTPLPAGWQLQHPRPADPPILTPVV